MSTPQRIGIYPVERELGRGGMGIVYLGRDPRLDRPIAIKVLPDLFAGDPERLARFEREARLLASLRHPNIAGIYGLEESDSRRFLALEYVEGPTLAERIARGPLPIDECLEIARQIAAALEAAHEAGVIHRDLKPGNVKITPAGEVKVLDFGLAKGAGLAEASPDISHSPTLTQARTDVGVILGTAAYMSPEQARGKPVDRRTDIWSFGCVLFEMFTGRQLFGGETVSDTIAKILEREPPWSEIPSGVPERIRELLRRCLEKDPRKRLRDIGDARLELEEAISARTSQSRRAAAEIEAQRSAARGRAPLSTWLVAGAAMIVALLAIAWALSRSPGGAVRRLSINEPFGASLDGDAVDNAISPDGRWLVFTASDTSNTIQLWARDLSTLGGRPIPGTENGAKPFWSPDSRWVGFFADGKLKKVRPDGGVQVICAAPDNRGGGWSKQGTIVFAPAGESPLFAVSASGGEPRQVTTLDSTRHETSHRFPYFLPDGRHFLYSTLPATDRGFRILAGSLDGGPSREILTADSAPVYAAPGYLIYLRDRTLVARKFDTRSLTAGGEPLAFPDMPATSQSTGLRAATVSSNGMLAYMNGAVTNSRLIWLDRAGRTIGAVPAPAAQYGLIVVSPDGTHAAVDRIVSPNESDIWILDLARGVSSRLTYGPRNNNTGIWSPDGTRIAFETNRNGPYDIYVKSVSGATPETPLVVGQSLFKHPASWTPDGKTLAFYQMDSGTGFDIWTVPADGSLPPTPYLRTRFQEEFPDISPDGKWLLYNSDESGRPEEYVQSFPAPGHKYQVTTGGALLGFWRKDGKEIIALGPDGLTLLAAEVTESGERFRASPPRPLFRTPPNVNGVGLVRDGQRFLIPIPEGKTEAPSITLVMNWPTELAAIAAARQ